MHSNVVFNTFPDMDKIAYSKSPDDDVFVYLALNYSRSHHDMHHSVNCSANEYFKDGITNGAAWYPLKGKVILQYFFFLLSPICH